MSEGETTSAFPAERVEAVDRAIEYWVQQLIDPGRRNNLLFYRDTKTTTLRLDDVNPRARERLLRGRPVSLDELVEPVDEESPLPDIDMHLFGADASPSAEEGEPADPVKDLRKRANTIYRVARTNSEEAGLETLYLAIGFATWDIGGGPTERPPCAPVLLMPMALSPRGRGSLRSFNLEPTGEVVVNPVLLHALGQQQVVATQSSLSDGIEGLDDGDPGLTSLDEAETVFERLTEAAHGLRGFEVHREYALGNFQYYKMAMVADLKRHRDDLLAHPIIAAIAGDASARLEAVPSVSDPEPRKFDTIPAKKQNLILNADSSQEFAIRRVLAGQNVVIQGPPGTGKSQTIANLMGALTAEGKRVLFVAEKRAALDAVKKRLDASQLGHLVFDLHGRGITKKMLAAQMAQALTRVRDSQPDDGGKLYRAHNRARKSLVQHLTAMHGNREPTGRSVYQLRSTICGTSAEARLEVDWKSGDVATLDAKEGLAHDLLDDLMQFEDLVLRTSLSPWAEGGVTESSLPEDLKATDVAWTAWQHLTERLSDVGLTAEGEEPLGQLAELSHKVTTHLAAAEPFHDSVWGASLDELARRLRPGLGSPFKRLWAFFTNGNYRAARVLVLNYRRKRPGIWVDVPGEVARASAARRAWHAETGLASPPAGSRVAETQAAIAAFQEALAALRARVLTTPPDESTWESTKATLRDLATDRTTPYRSALLHSLSERCRRDVPPLAELIAAIEKTQLPAGEWIAAFDHAVAAAAYAHVTAADAAVQGFDGRRHDDLVSRFQESDRDLLPVAARRVVRHHASHFIDVCNEHPEQDGIIRREAEKRSRHLPLRTLLEKAPDVLTALFPCWLASPLSVSQLLAGGTYFDVVLFDEASQVFPHDAVPSILRGRQLVVAGDRHQLPPTAFFAGAEELGADDEAGAAEGFESLLDQTSAFLPSSLLQWHYRSKDERLIAFSNHHIYSGSLITFPGSGRHDQVIGAEVVPFRADAPESTRSGHDEVIRVVELILEHASLRPKETLGVIAPGVEHARRLEFQLDQELSLRPDLDEFFDPSKEERFFVKNLERVQGDERDAIIFSIGYAKDRGGSLPHRFGPITHEQGHRRLNVAVSRAKQRMTVVSSFRWDEINLQRSGSRGVRFLRDYLRFAQSGGVVLGDEGEKPIPLNAFEKDIFDELTAAGLELLPQFGSSGYRIDMVAAHPTRPGRYVLAIECDGATYHSAPIARERDRLRQEILEALGWRFHRIWSTDWWNRRELEVERAVEAFETAWRWADDEDLGATEPVPVALPIELPVEESAPPPQPERAEDLRPYLAIGLPITKYDHHDLVQLARYLLSDGRLYTDAQLIDEMARELGKRKGRRIVAALTRAAQAAR